VFGLLNQLISFQKNIVWRCLLSEGFTGVLLEGDAPQGVIANLMTKEAEPEQTED